MNGSHSQQMYDIRQGDDAEQMNVCTDELHMHEFIHSTMMEAGFCIDW